MANIRDFTPGAAEQRGVVTVQRYPDDPTGRSLDQPDCWRFGIPVTATVDGEAVTEVWLRLNQVAVGNYQDDGTILSVVATELLAMGVNADPDAALSDGRKLADLKPADLYAAAPTP